MTAKTAVVAGDLLVDWSVAVDTEMLAAARSWKEAGRVHRYKRPGGAWLASELIQSMARDLKDWSVIGPDEKTPEHVHTTHSLLAPQPDGIWRINQFLGVERASQAVTPQLPAGAANADLVVLLDSGLGFMAEASCSQRFTRNPWIILKSGEPDLHAPFCRALAEHHAKRTIVVLTVDDLRRMEVHVSRRLSWERTAQETVEAIRKSSVVSLVEAGGQAVVSFGAAGAIVIGDGKAELIFDPSVMEGEWEKAAHGAMIGASTILAASIAYELMTYKEKQPSMPKAIQRGVAGMRALFKNGYGDRAAGLSAIGCPIEPVVKEALNVPLSLSRVDIASSANCTTLTNHVAAEAEKLRVTPDDYLHQLASAVAVFGPEQMLTAVPHLKIGDLFTADRSEIEAFRSIKSLLAEYVKNRSNRPFSIAVFGPPGSGKSFGVEQVAKSIPGMEIQKLIFNLTQFADPRELHGAYHQVRDVALSGKMPLVFWDEFDTRQGTDGLGWPRHFIGPMQDGVFQDGPLTHPIGTSIFVFAGGTCATFDEFTTWKEEDDRERRQLKIPDFISRLKGHLNVLGPNRRKSGDDPFHVIRRAILLRSLLLRHARSLFITEGARQILQIERDVLCSFLHADEYRYGARSLEAIVTMSSLAGRKIFDGSSLPPEVQRKMHVEKFDCPSAAARRQFGDDLIDIEQLAEFAHQIFCRIRRKHGWTYGPVRNDGEKVHNLLVDYGALSWSDKESNRDTVRKIPDKLAAINAVVQPARPGERRPELRDADIAQLAPLEHDRWMKVKAAQGFTPGNPTRDEPRRSPYMVPWDKLPQEFKETDISMVSAIPDMLAEAGYTFVRKGS